DCWRNMEHELITRIWVRLQDALLEIGHPVLHGVNTWKIDLEDYLSKRGMLQWLARNIINPSSRLTFHVRLPFPCRRRSSQLTCRRVAVCCFLPVSSSYVSRLTTI